MDNSLSRTVIMNIKPKTYNYDLLENVHKELPPPQASETEEFVTSITRGGALPFYHTGCDGYSDDGKGSAYRVLQSMAAWVQSTRGVTPPIPVPSIPEIQAALVRIGGKTQDLINSKDWIGALEVFDVVDALYRVPCQILHVPKSEPLLLHAAELHSYFEDFGGFVMIGGEVDTATKGIAGVHMSESGKEAYFLIIDPNFEGTPKSAQELIDAGCIRWQNTTEFVDSSFYDLCLPLLQES